MLSWVERKLKDEYHPRTIGGKITAPPTNFMIVSYLVPLACEMAGAVALRWRHQSSCAAALLCVNKRSRKRTQNEPFDYAFSAMAYTAALIGARACPNTAFSTT